MNLRTLKTAAELLLFTTGLSALEASALSALDHEKAPIVEKAREDGGRVLIAQSLDQVKPREKEQVAPPRTPRRTAAPAPNVQPTILVKILKASSYRLDLMKKEIILTFPNGTTQTIALDDADIAALQQLAINLQEAKAKGEEVQYKAELKREALDRCVINEEAIHISGSPKDFSISFDLPEQATDDTKTTDFNETCTPPTRIIVVDRTNYPFRDPTFEELKAAIVELKLTITYENQTSGVVYVTKSDVSSALGGTEIKEGQYTGNIVLKVENIFKNPVFTGSQDTSYIINGSIFNGFKHPSLPNTDMQANALYVIVPGLSVKPSNNNSDSDAQNREETDSTLVFAESFDLNGPLEDGKRGAVITVELPESFSASPGNIRNPKYHAVKANLGDTDSALSGTEALSSQTVTLAIKGKKKPPYLGNVEAGLGYSAINATNIASKDGDGLNGSGSTITLGYQYLFEKVRLGSDKLSPFAELTYTRSFGYGDIGEEKTVGNPVVGNLSLLGLGGGVNYVTGPWEFEGSLGFEFGSVQAGVYNPGYDNPALERIYPLNGINLDLEALRKVTVHVKCGIGANLGVDWTNIGYRNGLVEDEMPTALTAFQVGGTCKY